MCNEDRVASVGRERPICLVSECQFGQDLATFEAEVPGRETFYLDCTETAFIRHGICSFDLSTARSLFSKAFDTVPTIAYKIVSNRFAGIEKEVTAMDTPELWQFTSSHFNEKARWALDFKRVPHIRHSMIPGFHVAAVKRMTGKTHVPVLKLNGTAISDSSRIIEALESAYPEPALYPADRDERRRALELEDYFDEELGPYIRRWIFHVILPYPKFVRAAFVSHASAAAQLAQRAMSPLIGAIMRRQMDISPATAEIARGKTMAAMDRLEQELQPSGYLVGDRFTVADLTAAALLSPLVRPPEFPYKTPAPVPEPLAKIRDAVSTHPAFRWTLETYRQHRGESAEVATQASAARIKTDASQAATTGR